LTGDDGEDDGFGDDGGEPDDGDDGGGGDVHSPVMRV
jgi:hypothetical protein